MLLATAVLLFVQIVATTTKEAMGAEDYVRPVAPPCWMSAWAY